MGGLSGIISTITGSAGAQAASQAGRLQAEATREGIAETRRQFDITQEQFAPFREAGVGALEQQQALLGLSGAEAQQTALSQFQQSPGQKFLQERQQRNLLRNQSAIGGLGGGNIRTALLQQGQQFAQTDLQNQLARLSGISGAGQQATQNLGALGAQTSGSIAQQLGQAGQAQASGVLGAAQARSQGVSNLIGLGTAAALGFGGGGGGVQFA